MGKQNTRLLCCGDSRLSFCHINTRISKPVEDISWKQFLSQEQSCQHCSCDKNCFKEMSSTGLKMRQNRFRTPLSGGAYSAPPEPLAGGEGADHPLPKNPTPPRPFGPRASVRCLVPQTPPKINPSYGLAGCPGKEAGKWVSSVVHVEHSVYDMITA